MSDETLIDKTVAVLGKLNRAEVEIENLKRLLEAARHHVEGNALGMWKFNPEGRPRAVQLHSEILLALSDYNLAQADKAEADAAAAVDHPMAKDPPPTTGDPAIVADWIGTLRGSATAVIDHPSPDPLDTPGIELHDLFGWAVFTASEGEDERFHAWFAEKPTAEAYVWACANAAEWMEGNPETRGAPPPLANAWNASLPS